MLKDLQGVDPAQSSWTVEHGMRPTVGSISSISLRASSSVNWETSNLRHLWSSKSCLAKGTKSSDFRSSVKRVSQDVVSGAGPCQLRGYDDVGSKLTGGSRRSHYMGGWRWMNVTKRGIWAGRQLYERAADIQLPRVKWVEDTRSYIVTRL